MPKIIDWAIASANAAASPLFRSMLPCTLVCVQIGVAPVLADSKSSAEFMLTTCLVAMDDLAKVEALARKNNWTDRTSSISTPTDKFMDKFMTSRTVWEVTAGEDRFFVLTSMGHFVETPSKLCSVRFRDKVNREEFLNSIFASVELTVIADTKFPQTHLEMYSVKGRSDRTAKLTLSISSRSDGTLIDARLVKSGPSGRLVDRPASPVWDSNPLPAGTQHNKPVTEGTTTISK
jgi:hypothetical protein